MNIKKSEAMYERACKVIPGGVNSPVRAFRAVGGTPIFMEKADGCFVTDIDGNTYLDFCNSWGPLIHGHKHPDIIKAIQNQIEQSLTLGTPCEGEVLLAEYIINRIKPVVPTIEKIRFCNSGTEAVMSSVRLARGFTGRNKIVKFTGCFHGHSDSLLVKAGSGLATAGIPDSAGVPGALTSETIVVPLADREALEATFKEMGNDIAAVIVEPVPANNGLLIQNQDYLEFLRNITEKHGSLLIFDEVINGFRISFGGAAEHYGIAPDLVTYGKIIGGGMPVGAFAGRSDIFEKLAPDGPVYQAGTLSGNPVAMAAGLAQMKLLTEKFYKDLEDLSATLDHFTVQPSQSEEKWKIRRMGSIFWFYQGNPPVQAEQINPESMKTYARFHRHCLENGIYMAPSGYEVGFISAAMKNNDLNRFLSVAEDFFATQ